ncbi:hypothetical protein ACS0ZG_28310 [Burkholderia gladioli]|uniref:hypothetical protein n=1 Tax=Burkholderia gladioli TaxID=28095 RepID=UPI003F795595
MLPITLLAFQRKGRWAYWHITFGGLFVLCGRLPQAHYLSGTCQSSALRIAGYRIDICSYGNGSHYSRNKNNRERGQMLQGRRIAIREHAFSCFKGSIEQQ